MASSIARKKIDATEGPLFSKMWIFVFPLMLTNVIQQLYTVADNMVVGKYAASGNALGAIGSCVSIIGLLTALFTGFSTGAAATVSHDFGARDDNALAKSVHTAVILASSAGFLVGAIGVIFAEPILILLNTKPEFLAEAAVYMRIRCIGMPFVALYNSASAVLRSVGDSKTPMYILTSSGLANVLLNLVFVIVFGMAADGVAYATLISQILSVVFVLWVLTKRRNENYALRLSMLRVDGHSAKRILKFAVPGTIQFSVAHVMNVFLSVAANSFSPEVIEARTVAANIDNVLSTIIATYATVTLTFTGQNRGAKKPDRALKSLLYAILQACGIALVVGQLLLFFREPLIRMFVNESMYDVAAITEHATTIMRIILTSYIISGVTNSFAGFIKGLGYALPPMVVSLIDMGIIRAIWIFVLFPRVRTLQFLYLVFPVSWGATMISYILVTLFLWKKAKARMLEKKEETQKA